MNRKKYLSNQLGKKIGSPGVHMPHAAVGLLLKKQREKSRDYYVKGGSKNRPLKEYDPFPSEEKEYKLGGALRSYKTDGE